MSPPSGAQDSTRSRLFAGIGPEIEHGYQAWPPRLTWRLSQRLVGRDVEPPHVAVLRGGANLFTRARIALGHLRGKAQSRPHVNRELDNEHPIGPHIG